MRRLHFPFRPWRAGLMVMLVASLLLACHPAANLSAGLGESVWGQAHQTPAIVGRADFSQVRKAQANINGMLQYATVALYDAVTGETRTSGVTDSAGNFSLNMPGFQPVNNGVYVLEAINAVNPSNGVNSTLPGSVAPRLRTLLQYTTGGWLSLTNGTPGGLIAINAYTTAVAVTAALDTVGLPGASAIGKVSAATPGSLNASPTFAAHPDSELNALAADIVNTLALNLDPVAVTNAIKPSITAVSPTSAAVNQPITVSGSGFVPGGSTIQIGGTSVPGSNVLLTTRSQIIFTVPSGVNSGNVTVATARGGTSNGIPFSVPNSAAVSVQTISPNPARPGASVTVTGTGFSTTLANNTVSIGGTQVTPDFANNSSLVFRVPTSAGSGNVSITVGGQTSNSYFLTVDTLTTPLVTSLFPNVGPNKSVLAIKGTNFGPSGSVLVGDYQAKVIAWNPSIIRVEVPWYTPAGNQTVSVFAALGIATFSFQVQDGSTVTNWTNTTALPATVGGPGVHAYVGGEKLWVWGGNGSTTVTYMPLNPDGSFAASSWSTSSLTLPEGTYQDDNPNSRVQIKNRVYYTVTNSLSAANSNHVNFATLDPYDGTVTGFGYDPINDLPPTWVGKDLALVASDRYVYIMGAGGSCSGDGVHCNGNSVGTMQAPLLESGNIGQWSAGPNQIPYGEDGLPFVIGDSLFQVGGTSGVSQQCVIGATGAMTSWATMSTPLLPNGSYLSTPCLKIGRFYYFYNMWSTTNSFKGRIVDDLVPQASTRLTSANTSPDTTTGVSCGIGHVDVQVGKYVYLISSHNSSYGSYQGVVRGTIQ